MTDKALKVVSGFLSLGLLLTLLIKLTTVPGGMILSGLALGIMMIIGILLICAIIPLLLRLLFKKYSYTTLYFITISIGFLIFHYTLYSPTLKITIPKGYTGEVTLVLANVKDNILVVDTNGIGYINQWTYDKTYTMPEVVNSDGKNVDTLCDGFNSFDFWGKGTMCCMAGSEFEMLSFRVTSKQKNGQMQYDQKDLIRLVDKKLVKFMKPDRYTIIDSVTIKK